MAAWVRVRSYVPLYCESEAHRTCRGLKGGCDRKGSQLCPGFSLGHRVALTEWP